MPRTEVKAEMWRLQHDADYHHSWAVKLPMWSTGLATSSPDSDELEVNRRGSLHNHLLRGAAPLVAVLISVRREGRVSLLLSHPR
eukprot:CAMPEP_0182567400 /NCGR_PEP_ID=MMETSP1324-20130603/8633_1 /TAXON_ID=236786 /ORGANISM="Florenciella sp., Strain RCC1587" /LENGTH=84 /DNA_ID=CAMNT_0024781391 /DNA_START=362 /DNA_END=614 /DNA_ORIENTATION=-